MAENSRQTRIATVLPWLCVVLFTSWAAHPLLDTEGRVFSGRLATDSIVTPWFYDQVARQLEEGRSTDWLTDLRHPSPIARTVEFPSDWDARLMAPVSWWSDWPESWGRVQAMVLLINGLGAAILARSLGARGPGIVVAGLLAVVCRPIWKDLIMARMNAAFPGLALGALGAWLCTLRATGMSVGPAVLATLLGATASLVYPPYVALLIPFGVLFGLPAVLRADWAGRLKAVAVVLLVAALVTPILREVASVGLSRTVACRNLTCPGVYNTVTWDRIFLWQPHSGEGLSASGSAGAALLLWPLVLFHRHRVQLGLASAGIAVLLGLSLGPCASWSPGIPMNLSALPFGLGPWVTWTHCQLEPLHDTNRLLTLGVLLAGVLGGLGAEALWGKGPWAGRRVLQRVAVVLVAGAAVGHAQWVVLSESLSPTKWHDAPLPAVAKHIQHTPIERRGPVLELPFDRSGQFLSILAEPSVPRGNPMRDIDRPPVDSPFWRWAWAVGQGDSIPAEPTPLEVRQSGMRWIYFDEDRCGNAAVGACTPSVQVSLRRVLGAPKRVGPLRIWEVDPP